MGDAVKTLKVAVIGCGRVSVMHFGAIQDTKNVELVACCDIKPDRADEAERLIARHPDEL